jgi:hypothetical protein
MSVNNILDGSFAVDSSGDIVNVELSYGPTNATTNYTTVNSFYVLNGKVCTLLLPIASTIYTNVSTISVIIPPEITPSQTATFYGYTYLYSSQNRGIATKIVASSNTITLYQQDSNTLAEGNFANSPINISNNFFITYLIE